MSGVHTLEATKNPAGLNLRGVVMAWDLLSVPSKGADDQKEGEQQAKPEIPKYAQQGFHLIFLPSMTSSLIPRSASFPSILGRTRSAQSAQKTLIETYLSPLQAENSAARFQSRITPHSGIEQKIARPTENLNASR